MDQLTSYNNCNPKSVSDCNDVVKSSRSITVKAEDDWGHVFKGGVVYKAGTSASLMGFGASEPIIIPARVSKSGLQSPIYQRDQLLSATHRCVAKPMQVVSCTYMAYKGTIEVGYTIFWKNASPTRGIYRGKAWTTAWSSVLGKVMEE